MGSSFGFNNTANAAVNSNLLPKCLLVVPSPCNDYSQSLLNGSTWTLAAAGAMQALTATPPRGRLLTKSNSSSRHRSKTPPRSRTPPRIRESVEVGSNRERPGRKGTCTSVYALALANTAQELPLLEPMSHAVLQQDLSTQQPSAALFSDGATSRHAQVPSNHNQLPEGGRVSTSADVPEAMVALQQLQKLQQQHGQLQQQQQMLQHLHQQQHDRQDVSSAQELDVQQATAQLQLLRAELGRVQAAETSTLSALRTQEEALLKLANQLKEAAHSEISTLQATEGRLLAVVQHSTARLKAMQAQRQQQQEQVAELLQNPENLMQLVLSGGYVMCAGGAVATAAAVYAASRIGSGPGRSAQGATGSGAAAGGSPSSSMNGGGAAGSAGAAGGVGGPLGRGVPGRVPVVAAAAIQGAVATAVEKDSRTSSGGKGGNTKWRSLLMSSIDDVPPFGLPSVSELPGQLSQLLASDNGSMMSHLHSKAAEAAAATQVLHVLQQQEAEAAVKSAELAANSLAAEKKLVQAVRSEATAAGRLLQVEHAAMAAAESDRRSSSSSGGGGGRVDVGMRQELEAARRQLEESVAARTAAQTELQALKDALAQEQKQSASVTCQLEKTQGQLSAVSAELRSMQQLLQQQKLEHAQALVAATQAKQASVDKHQMLQQREVSSLQLSEQRLNAELAEAQQQLSEVLRELEQERETKGGLHSEIMTLQNQFADTRAVVDAERKRAAALTEERSKLEAALDKAAKEAAAAEAEAAAAKQQAKAAAQQAQQAAAEAEDARAKLSEVKDQAQQLGTQLHVAVEVVAQQQEVLQQRAEQLGQLQEEVVTTRDALRHEREEKVTLQCVTSSLKARITNMAATREAHNKQLSSQINKLRSQLDKSKKVQHESQHQIITLKESFTTAKQHLMREQLASRTHAATAAELQQRLANLRATGSKSVTSAVVVVDDAREHTQAMVQEAVRTAQQLEKVTGEVQELRHKLAAESASKVEYQKTTEELKQRLANLHATGERHAAAAQAAAAAMAAARGSRGSRGSSVSCDSDTGRYSRPPSPSVEVDKLRQQHQKELQDLQEQLTAAVAAAEEAGHAALAQQQEQLELLQQQLAASRVQAEAAQAAEEVAREQVLALREQLRQQQDALDAQGQALKVARDEMMRLKERAAHFGSQLETERAKALSHEATAEELKQRIATLQELKLKEQLEHSEAIDKMIAQLKDAQAKVAEASEVRKKAEVKCITARDEMSRHQQQLTLVHKHQQDLESRLRNMASVHSMPRGVATALQEQLAKSGTELELAERQLRELERHFFVAQSELAESQLRAEDLEAEVHRLQGQLAEATIAAQHAADSAADEQQRLQEQLQQQQQQLDHDRAMLEELQRQAVSTKEDLNQQHKAAAALQQQVAALHNRLATTETEKAQAEHQAAELAGQLADAQEEMQVLQTAHAETEQVAAQVAADLASAREWAYINASRFSEMQRQLGEYRADLEDTQENLKLTHEKLQEAEAQHAAVGEQLAVTQEQLAAEQVAHGNTHEQLAAARTALDKVKAQYLSTRDQLEAERARRLQLEGTVADLRERLEKLQQLREQQHVAAAAERAKWLEQMADGQKQQEEARTALANMQQEYFNAYERLETEQQRVGTLENIVGQLEERMTELSEAAMAAPAASALEVGGPAAELVVTCNALRKEWKSATAALSTSRHMLSSLEQEYKDSRAAVDVEHHHYAEVEASLEFLQERLEAAERDGAGEEERYQHTTAELHEQLERQASELVECQHRIANLKEELEASRQRLEDEQEHEAQLARRAQELEAEAAAAGRQLQQAGVDVSNFPAIALALPEEAAANVSAVDAAAPAATAFPVGWSAGQAAPVGAESSIAEGIGSGAIVLGAVDEQAGLAQASTSGADVANMVPTLQLAQQQQESVVAGYDALDMSAVRKHVEEMAAQYVAGLRKAEAELQVVRSVWQQAEDELAAMRSSPRGSSDGGRTGSPRVTAAPCTSAAGAAADAPSSPRLMTASGKVAPHDFDLLRAAPAAAPQVVSGSSHAGAEAEHGLNEAIAVEVKLPSPRFGGGHVGNFPEGYQGPSGRAMGSSGGSVAAKEGGSSASSKKQWRALMVAEPRA